MLSTVIEIILAKKLCKCCPWRSSYLRKFKDIVLGNQYHPSWEIVQPSSRGEAGKSTCTSHGLWENKWEYIGLDWIALRWCLQTQLTLKGQHDNFLSKNENACPVKRQPDKKTCFQFFCHRQNFNMSTFEMLLAIMDNWSQLQWRRVGEKWTYGLYWSKERLVASFQSNTDIWG